MRTAEDVEQLLEQLKPDIIERMGIESEEEWQVGFALGYKLCHNCWLACVPFHWQLSLWD